MAKDPETEMDLPRPDAPASTIETRRTKTPKVLLSVVSSLHETSLINLKVIHTIASGKKH